MSNRRKGSRAKEPSLAEVLSVYASHPEFESRPLTDVNSRGSDNSVLNIAAYRGELAHVKVLIANKAQVDSHGDMGYTPLHDAVDGGHLDVASYLLDHGANPALQNEFGDTALELAIKSGNQEMAKLIRRHIRR